MPIDPQPGESESAFIDRCIPIEVKAGKPQAQASAICFSKFRESSLREAAEIGEARLRERIHRPEDRRKKKRKTR